MKMPRLPLTHFRSVHRQLVPAILISSVLGLFMPGCAFRTGKQPRQEITPLYSASSPAFRASAGALLGSDFVPGNDITTLVNGTQIFPAMLDTIRSAKQTINFETYIFSDGKVGREFTEVLVERARAGVKVSAIFDALGTHNMSLDDLARLRKAGVEVVNYHSIFWFNPFRYNHRDHRRLLVVDGKTAFVGGVGFADEWLGNADSPEHWRDNQYRVTGPVVAQLQAIFIANWLKTRGTLLHGADYFPPLASTGSSSAQALRSSAGNANLDLMYLLAIASAQKTLRIENAYFLPDDLTRKELTAAARRGVKIEIIVPGKLTDVKIVRAASKRHWPELLNAGIKIYEYQPTMMHVKLIIVDDTFVSVGSGNFDKRSIQLNDEANLDVLDGRFAAQQTQLFELDKKQSRKMTLDDTNDLHPLQGAVDSQL
jgi:cardiolipin synthase A/B